VHCATTHERGTDLSCLNRVRGWGDETRSGIDYIQCQERYNVCRQSADNK
jgi:hypothetical protein